MSTQVAEPVAVSADSTLTNEDNHLAKDSFLADQSELDQLMLEQINIAKRVEAKRVETAYSLYGTLRDFLTSNKLSLSEFFEVCENKHKEIHGTKPTSLHKDLNLTQSGQRRTLPVKYRDKINPDNIWSGRGKQPLWLTARIEEGYRTEDFLTANQKESKTTKRKSRSISTRSADAATKRQRKTAVRPTKTKVITTT